MTHAEPKILAIVRSGHWGLLAEYASAGYDMMAAGNAYLKLAIRRRDIATVIMLLEAVNPNVGSNYDTSPLGMAVRMGDAEILMLLCEKGALVSSIHPYDWQYYYNMGNYPNEQRMKDIIETYKKIQFN